jgi:hypothetical protein
LESIVQLYRIIFVGVRPNIKLSQNRYLLEMMRLFSLGIGNAIATL